MNLGKIIQKIQLLTYSFPQKTKGKKNKKWEFLRHCKIKGSTGNKLANLSNTSVEPASKASMGGHASPSENPHINQKPPSCFWILMIESQQHLSISQHKCRATLELSRRVHNDFFENKIVFASTTPLKMVD